MTAKDSLYLDYNMCPKRAENDYFHKHKKQTNAYAIILYHNSCFQEGKKKVLLCEITPEMKVCSQKSQD